ncbi:MAG: hypothetical protein QM783_08600 [Phycisphaerales bacterium]
MTEQTAIPQHAPLTRPQALVLCALLGAMTLVMAWFALNVYKVSQPPVKELVRSRSIIGQSMATIRYLQGEPDAACRVEGWSVTYSSDDSFDRGVIAALRVDPSGTVVDCALYKEKTGCDLPNSSVNRCGFARSCDYTDASLLPFRR